MFKHSISLLVACIATMTLAGCELYFGDDHHGDDDQWSYCGQDGYYQCTGNDCYWQSAECPPDSQQPPPGGYECDDNSDCAAGCYCQDGVCEEAGFCTTDADCGDGYVCNTERSSCEPGTPPETHCGADTDCPAGQYCDAATTVCTASCTCTTDAEAKAGGFDYCDESRGTCAVGVDPTGDCTGTVTCNLGRPTCPEGQVALISNGCYTGQCEAISSCGSTPTCEAYTHEADCPTSSCTLSYTGINCHTSNNTPCTAGSSSACVCDSYQFSKCLSGSSPRMVVEYNGFTFDATPLMLNAN